MMMTELHLIMMVMTMRLPRSPPTMQRMQTQRLSLSSGTVDQGSAMLSGVSFPTKQYYCQELFKTFLCSLRAVDSVECKLKITLTFIETIKEGFKDFTDSSLLKLKEGFRNKTNNSKLNCALLSNVDPQSYKDRTTVKKDIIKIRYYWLQV